MNYGSALVFFLCSAPVGAATILFTAPTLFSPSEVWGVKDPEMMTVSTESGRVSFRRPGLEQCLEKATSLPVPCDSLEAIPDFSGFNYDEDPVPGYALNRAYTLTQDHPRFTTPVPPVLIGGTPVCCTLTPPAPPAPPIGPPTSPIPIPASLLSALSGLVLLFAIRIMRQSKL